MEVKKICSVFDDLGENEWSQWLMIKRLVLNVSLDLRYRSDFFTSENLLSYMILIIISYLNFLRLSNFLNQYAESGLVNTYTFK